MSHVIVYTKPSINWEIACNFFLEPIKHREGEKERESLTMSFHLLCLMMPKNKKLNTKCKQNSSSYYCLPLSHLIAVIIIVVVVLHGFYYYKRNENRMKFLT